MIERACARTLIEDDLSPGNSVVRVRNDAGLEAGNHMRACSNTWSVSVLLPESEQLDPGGTRPE